MGKKRIIESGNKEEAAKTAGAAAAPTTTAPKFGSKKRIETGILNIESSYNNTKVVLTDTKGNTLAWSTAGALGFKGAKKGTPFAAAKVGEVVASKAETIGIQDIHVVVKGVGSGRESSIRGFISKGFNIASIKDMTPVP